MKYCFYVMTSPWFQLC